MGRRKNSFSKALGHLKSTRIDEKLQMLNEVPTNNTSNLYTVVPNASSRLELDKNNPVVPDYDTIDWEVDGSDGKDTSGLFDDSGNHVFVSPPGDNSYILGPMAAMFYNYSYYSDWTMIGYIRESDRRFVNLGYIQSNSGTGFDGKLSSWDGENHFSSYGQLTIEQAKWFRDTTKKDGGGNHPDEYNYRAFYPGPPSTPPDAYGRYLCCITGTPKTQKDNLITRAPIELQSDSNFSAMLDRLIDSPKNIGKSSGKKIWDVLSDETGGVENTTWAKLGGSILRSVMDPVTYAGDYVFKGLPSGTPYNPAFTGSGPKILGGKKLTDMLGGLFGKDVQYFTPDLNTAVKYAGEGGNVVAMPRPQTGVRGFKNWLGSTVSRGFDPTKGVEQIVKTSDSVAQRNLTKIINLSQAPNAQKNLQKLAAKGATNNKILAKVGKAVPFLNAGLVATDVTTRIAKGDYAGALLGAAQIIPGPIGWIALGTQVTYDVSGARELNAIPWNRPVEQEYDVSAGGDPSWDELMARDAAQEDPYGTAWGGSKPKGQSTKKGTQDPFASPIGSLGAQDGDKIAWGGKPKGPPTKKIGGIRGATAEKDAMMSVNGMGLSPKAFEKKYGIPPQEYIKLPHSQSSTPNYSPMRVATRTKTRRKKKDLQIASYDVVGNVLAESVDEESALMSKNMGAALIEMGLPKDKKDFIKEMGFYLMLQDQMDPNMLAMILKALQGEKLSREQKGWIKNNLKPMVDGIVNYDPVKSKELNPDNPINSDEDPWALKEEKMIRVLKTLKDPVVIPETRQKSYKVSPGRKYKKGKTNFQGMEKLIGDIESQESFKTSRYSWSDGWQGYNARSSQDKKNIVLEKIGDGKQAWNYMLNNGTMRSAKQLEEFWGKNPDFYSYSFGGKKYRPTRKEQVKGDYVVFLVDEAGVNSSMLQSELNMKLAEDSEKEMLAEYNRINKVEPISYEKDPLFKRVAKILKPNIDYEDKPAVKGHPNEPPPKMVKGVHPDLGKKYKYDKLDPVSAIAMKNAPTGNPEIDANVEKAAKKPK